MEIRCGDENAIAIKDRKPHRQNHDGDSDGENQSENRRLIHHEIHVGRECRHNARAESGAEE
jgi:hypothetical protein